MNKRKHMGTGRPKRSKRGLKTRMDRIRHSAGVVWRHRREYRRHDVMLTGVILLSLAVFAALAGGWILWW